MRELNINEVQEVNGGNPLVVMAAVYVTRKYGSVAVMGAIGFIAGWLSED